jgi:cytochrome c oxidase subunit III
MSTLAPAAHSAEGHDHGHDHGHGHSPFLAHHFENHEQQFDSGKLGMWLFLITEILFFSGLFTAYAVYRANHPEIFTYGHMFLNPTLGALNTIVLLFSSLTMAWAVRCAQLGQKQGLVILLAITWLCALTFLVVKYFEYSHKFHLGIYPAKYFVYGENPHGEITATGTAQPAAGAAAVATHEGDAHATAGHDAKPAADAHGKETHGADAHGKGEHAAGGHGDEGLPTRAELPRDIGIYFSIYYCLTGLHGIHIVGGMIAIGWIFRRSLRGDFGPEYFGPVDFVGLYWHLVDLIWIYLFPLLYLIH